MSTAPVTRYVVSLHQPHTRLIEVEGRFPTQGQAEVELVLPVWTPGSYFLREYARHLQEFAAADAAGTALGWTRKNKRTFTVKTGGAAEVVARWKVYANDLTVRSNHFDDSHAYFNGAALFLHQEAHRAAPHHVRIDGPQAWNAHCVLPTEGGAFVAKDYDTLVDSPFEVGPEEAHRFVAAGVPHDVVIWGQGNLDVPQLLKDLQAIVEVEAKLFGGLPFDRYLFILLLSDKGRGGLEHKASTTLLYPRFGFKPRKAYEELLTLAAHEYFHLWNVKRIKPAALVPFDYGQESFTTLLWAMEGLTSYYDTLLTRRAGLLSADRYLERQGENLTSLAQTPGRQVQSLGDASTCAWIKYYRQDENTANSAVSYYLKGEIVGMLLDLELRQATGGKKSLDDLMRLLFERYGDERGVDEAGIERAAAEVAGKPLQTFFDRAVRSTAELDYALLSTVGLEVRARQRDGASDKGGTPEKARKEAEAPKGYLGAVTRTVEGRAVVTYALAGTPAMRDGLLAEDELVAMDGYRIDPDKLTSRVEELPPGARVTFTLLRREQLRTVAVQLDEKPRDTLWLARRDDATPAQKAAFEAWLGEPFDPAKPVS
jgi:predicted metalloprotease with PDZ domain